MLGSQRLPQTHPPLQRLLFLFRFMPNSLKVLCGAVLGNLTLIIDL
ncbi:hypothetical protein GXM_07632 [Nostoc sphaeroides CCNUC1]|uniref:Uncharacterized protein n=1 Tax=Nostoc sphaeroides CCNUC1 TaxID=2653204 RepID=A0A5P8WBH3_9NOSO|nr:hypothetical protein GXM_07632 [Nostoc sphaeroides CCNUC1]